MLNNNANANTQNLAAQAQSMPQNTQYNLAQAQSWAQIGLNNVYSQHSSMWPQEDWVFNGKAYSITDFAELVYGDTPERDVFLLKYTRIGDIE